MDTTATPSPLMLQFQKTLRRPDLRCEPPTQFSKTWDNAGQSSPAEVFEVWLVNQPCEIKFTLLFDHGDIHKTGPVLKTSITIKFRGETLINQIHLGDDLDYQSTRRIDPIAYLRQTYAPPSMDDPEILTTDSFALAIDDDSEANLMKAVSHLTGKSEDELRTIWTHLVADNSNRSSKEQVSPFIKIWLKKQRAHLDVQILNEAEILTPREHELVIFAIKLGQRERHVQIATTRLSGSAIRQNIEPADPHWWGCGFYGFQVGRLVKLPHEPNEIAPRVAALNSNMLYEIEHISVDGRPLFAVILEGQNKTMVWRTRYQPAPAPAAMPPTPAPSSPPLRIERSPHSPAAKTQSPPTRAAPISPPPPSKRPTPPPIPSFSSPPPLPTDLSTLQNARNHYIESLVHRISDLPERRLDFIHALYHCDRSRYKANPDALSDQFTLAIQTAFPNDHISVYSEKFLALAEIKKFYAKML